MANGIIKDDYITRTSSSVTFHFNGYSGPFKTGWDIQ